MAKPQILLTYPADNDLGIPVGQQIKIVFDRGIDLSTARNSIVLYGTDFDLTSGPDSAEWIDSDTGDNPYFLRSPGFQGLVEVDLDLEYVDLSTGSAGYTTVAPDITSEADEVSENVGHRLIVTPREPLAPDLTYTLHIVGNEAETGKGIGSRTVFDTVPNPGNTSDTGEVVVYGGYTGSLADTLNIQITTSGDIGVAKYKYWYTSAGVGTAKLGQVTSRRFRNLIDGLQVRFTGSGFETGDIFEINVEPVQYLENNYQISFSTNDGSYATPPDSPSTPATSEPPDTVLPPPLGVEGGTFYIVDSVPLDKSYGNSRNTRRIQLEFNNYIDATSVTQDNVRIYKYPASGVYQGQPDMVELAKKITVEDNLIILEI